VIEAEARFYREQYANVHRGVHLLSQEATVAYDAARRKVQTLLHAREAREVIFVRGTTEAINLVAQTYGRRHVGENDEVVVSALEHHSNIVPWQILCEEKNARLRVIPVNDAGEVSIDDYRSVLSPRTKIVALAHVSNALGTVLPVREMVGIAHERGIPVLLDGAQAVARTTVDVQDIGCDFYAFSGHKLYGPSGTGVLYGRAELLESMPPYQGGGDMIRTVTFEKSTYNDIPYRFEAGTPNIAGAVGLGASIDYVRGIGLEAIESHEKDLLDHATASLASIPEVRIIGTARERMGLVSFVVGTIHAHDVGTVLDMEGIAVRAGHHCAQPLMDRFGVPATVRASFSVYNTRQEVDALLGGVRKVLEVFR
jgi:cysteine desulfurase/selenocysteine lyase